MDIVRPKIQKKELKQKNKIPVSTKNNRMNRTENFFDVKKVNAHANSKKKSVSGFGVSKNSHDVKVKVQTHKKLSKDTVKENTYRNKKEFFTSKQKNNIAKNYTLSKNNTEKQEENLKNKETEIEIDNSKDLFLDYKYSKKNDNNSKEFSVKKGNNLTHKNKTKKEEYIDLTKKFGTNNKNDKNNKVKFFKKFSSNFGIVALGLLLFMGVVFFVGDAIATKNKVLASKDKIIDSAKRMAVSVKKADLDSLYYEIENSQKILFDTQKELRSIGKGVIWASKYVPGASKLASADALLDATTNLTDITQSSVKFARDLKEEKIKDGESFNWLDLVTKGLNLLNETSENINLAQKKLEIVKIDDLPQKAQKHIANLKRVLPEINLHLREIVKLSPDIKDAFGKNSPKTYLFLFQNNQEMRATGGFIGSYGILNITNGKIEDFYINGIFDPDGQLIDRIVPPLPIQKISAAWSLHDSNWWPDFPKSAETAMNFYERTGGESVDGVIVVTPTMVKKLLSITGPIQMDEYGITITSDNFIEKTQYKVEIDYDKKENKPKKILSDLFPLIINKLKTDFSSEEALKIVNVIIDGLDERHILLYSKNKNLENYITNHRWGGRVQETDGDYLSIINTNINGFKTDGVVDQKISHVSQVNEDGSIIDTVSIIREHRGGHTGKPWWDAVNADYMRVYVPEGSELISVEGQTREINKDRLLYDKMGFEKFKSLKEEEENMQIDEKTGTRIYNDSNKTVFANWVYVSPQEKVKITYKYKLPIKIKFKKYKDKSVLASHSLLIQKQAGDVNTKINTKIVFPKNINIKWSTAKSQEHALVVSESKLDRDYYYGVVLEK